MKPTASNPRPIGLLLKRADALLTARIDAAQRANGLTRSEWQVLNLLHEWKSAPLLRLEEDMQAFLDGDELGERLQSLQQRGLVDTGASGNVRLTGAGEHLHAVALAQQKQVREQATKGISADEYQKAIGVLERLVANLEG
jgi:DNA-binding MarR family transcriptional regulator